MTECFYGIVKNVVGKLILIELHHLTKLPICGMFQKTSHIFSHFCNDVVSVLIGIVCL